MAQRLSDRGELADVQGLTNGKRKPRLGGNRGIEGCDRGAALDVDNISYNIVANNEFLM